MNVRLDLGCGLLVFPVNFPPCCFSLFRRVDAILPSMAWSVLSKGRLAPGFRPWSPGSFVRPFRARGSARINTRIFPIFLVLSRYCILKLFEVLGLTRFFEFCPLSGSSGARSRGSSLTRHDGSGCCPYPNGWNASRLVQNRHRAFSPT